MTRTRIVKGRIVKITEGAHSMYAKENIVEHAAATNTETGAESGISFNEPQPAPVQEIKAKCIVQFRPHANWKGEYGFDWIRSGDTGQKGDVWYKNIIGNYVDPSGILQQIYVGGIFKKNAQKYDKLISIFEGFVVPWKKKVQGRGFLYKIPVMTIAAHKSYKLSLKVEVEEKPKKITLKQRKTLPAEKDNFAFNVADIPVKSGKYTLDNFIEIKCTESFRKDKYIDVFADDEKCGTLKVLANHESVYKKVKVLFITVNSASGAGSTTGEAERLSTYLQQAYITAEVKKIRMDLSKDKKFIPTLKANSGVHQYLNNKLKSAKFPDGSTVGNKYDSYYKVYFINEVIQQAGGSYLLGQADGIPSTTVYVLDLAGTATAAGVDFESVKTTATHELLHALGLSHTFDNSSQFTLEKYRTDNIMDYYAQSTDIKAKQIYKWQWEFLRKVIK